MKKTRYSIALLTLLGVANAAEVTLDTIEVISPNKTKQEITKTTSNIDVITSEEINKNGYGSIGEAISGITGINFAQSGGLGQKSSFFMRGMDSGKILVLVDGMRINDPSTTNNTAMIEFLPISNVEQIEIIRGGSSSIWGANASAGVINIITKNSTKDGISGSIGVNGGSHQTKGGDATIFYKNGKLNAKLLGSIIDTDGISALAPRDSERDGFNNQNLTAGIGYDFMDTTKASLTVIKTKTKGDFDDNYNPNGANDNYSNFITDSTNVQGLLSTKIGNVDTTLNISRGEYDREYFTTSAWGDGDNVYKAIIDEYSLINSYTYKLGKSVLGLEYKDIDGFNQYNAYAPTDGSYKNRAVFLANTLNPTDKLLLEANIRYDHFKEFDNKTTYKIGAKYDLPNDFKVGVNYYTSLNAPSVYQLANPVFGTILKPSYVRGHDISLAYKDYLSLTYFNNKIKDDIVYDYVNWGYYNNSADEKIRGFELSVKSPTMLDMFIARANYTHLMDMKDKSGAPLYNRANDEVNLFVDYFYNDSTTASINGQYIGDRVSVGNQSSGNYTVWNLNLTKEFSDNIDLGVHLKNILNKDYQSIYGYNSEGRSLYVDARYKF